MMRVYWFYLTILCSTITAERLWGPGLRPRDVVLPARYIYVDPGERSSTKEDLFVDISGSLGSDSCRIWVDKLHLNDGLYIIRYRLYETCDNLKIEIKYKNKHLGDSPYYLKGPIYHEDCDCPSDDWSEWSERYGCPAEIEQLNSDLRPFKQVNMEKVLKIVLQKYDNPGGISLCYYAIKNNELYRQCYGKHVGFNMFADAILLSVLRKVKIPDQSFFLNLGDWPLVKKSTSPPIPIFSWCGSEDTDDIVLPTYDLTESTLENMGRVMLDMLSVQGNIATKWDDKIPQAFWRGRDSRRERLNLIDIARENQLYNVSLTNFFFFRDEEKKYGPKVPHISFFKFFDFKYQINIDGTVAAYRFPYLLAGDSLVLKQDSPYYEHFYKMLEPGKHYVPFKRDLSDLTKKIKWAQNHDNEAKSIAENAQSFARENLMPVNIICYYAKALNEWSKRIKGPVNIPDTMERIPQSDNSKRPCVCTKNKPKNKDEL